MELLSDFSLTPWLYAILMVVYVVTIIGCIGVVLSENRNPIKSLAWVTVLIFLPVAGLVLYLFFGRSLKGLHMISRHNKRKIISEVVPQRPDSDDIFINEFNRQIMNLADSMGANYCRNNEVEIFTDGASKFESLKQDLRSAEHTIYLQYYIFSDDNLGHEIAEILIDKAARGVKVNVIYDHVGSFTVKTRFFKKMRKAGVEAYPFFRVTFPQLANRINWRNHRKIVVIDGKIGYIGGMNIADRYVNGIKNGEIWRDTHFRLRGEIVAQLLYSFASDWSFMHRPLIHEPKALNKYSIPANNTGIQLISGGPTDNWPNIEFVFLKAISSARKCIYIQSPYFLPTDSMLRALQTAALAKVDVRVIIPRKGDSAMLRYASYSYIAECMRAGIKIYLYELGMMHSKSMVIDDEFATSGSTNFDFRSFEQNFESNLLMYDKDINARMKNIFFEDLSHSTKLTISKWRRRPLPQRLLESVLRLLSPVL